MPTTRQSVIDAITAIEDKGNNTAAEVRNVLDLLLKHGEENPRGNGGNLEIFQFENDDFIDSEIRNFPETIHQKFKQLNIQPSAGRLKYSFRGIHEHTVDFTFLLQHSFESNPNDNTFNFFFKLPEDVENALLKNILIRENQKIELPREDGSTDTLELNASVPLFFPVTLGNDGQVGATLLVFFFEEYFALIFKDFIFRRDNSFQSFKLHTTLPLHNSSNIRFMEAVDFGNNQNT